MVLKKALSTLIVGILATSTLLAGCSSKEEEPKEATTTPDTQEETVEYPTKALDFSAPAGAGGGYDTTMRTMAKVLKDNGLVDVAMPVTNRSGGGGGVNLAFMQELEGSDNFVCVYSPPLLLINLTGSTELSYKDTTPIAGLMADYDCFVVPKNSKYNSITEVFDALKEDPKSVKYGGNSSAGSFDHLAFLIMAKAAGLTVDEIKQIDYISFQDGTAPAQLMGEHIDLLSTGLGDVKGLIEGGEIKVLATTADKRVGTGAMAEVPTCMELGIDATAKNWRGIFGAPGMPEYAVKFWEETLKTMTETEDWKKASEQNGWDIVYLNTADFNAFLDETNEEYIELLKSIDMLAE